MGDMLSVFCVLSFFQPTCAENVKCQILQNILHREDQYDMVFDKILYDKPFSSSKSSFFSHCTGSKFCMIVMQVLLNSFDSMTMLAW